MGEGVEWQKRATLYHYFIIFHGPVQFAFLSLGQDTFNLYLL